jgi:hypothetical protein
MKAAFAALMTLAFAAPLLAETPQERRNKAFVIEFYDKSLIV